MTKQNKSADTLEQGNTQPRTAFVGPRTKTSIRVEMSSDFTALASSLDAVVETGEIVGWRSRTARRGDGINFATVVIETPTHHDTSRARMAVYSAFNSVCKRGGVNNYYISRLVERVTAS